MSPARTRVLILAARLRVTLDRRLGRTTPKHILWIAQFPLP